MAGYLCVWLWGRLRTRAYVQLCERRFAAAVVAVLFLALAPPGALADKGGGNENTERRDTQSRNEQKAVDRISLVTDAGDLIVLRIVLIDSRIVEVSQAADGVRFESLDRVDVSDIPLLGDLFGRPLRAGDLTDDNRVGAVYSAGDGTLAAVVDDSVDVGAMTISVVNGKGRFELLMPPQKAVIVPADLGEFGTLRSVQSVLAGAAPPETTMVLGGLTRTSVPQTENKVPVLGDIPVLQHLFRGTVHRREQNHLLLLIRPSIVAGEEEY